MQGLQEQLLAKGSRQSQISATRSYSKQVWNEPKLVSVTLSSLLLCPCINNCLLFMAVPHRTPHTRACGVTSEDGAELAAARGHEGPLLGPENNSPSSSCPKQLG